ncbi:MULTISPECIES: hypothetical protein [Exiguobacterium]|uniref:hypothetical protein n=1 Tax=Exiguobacterium sp. UBA1053 TaxID=1946487 RepID=UPI0025B7FD40|nr:MULTISPECIES: hypothetical protein [Exiguobacterium]
MSVINKLFYTLFKAIVVAILSIYFTSIFDIASKLSFVPPERSFVTSNTIYIAILIFIFSIFEELYNAYCLKFEMFFSADTDKRSEKENPTVILDEKTKDIGFARIYLDISITGTEKSLAKNKVILFYPESITLQPAVNQQGFVNVETAKRKCEVDILKLVNENSKHVTTTNCKVIFSVLKKDDFSGTEKLLSVDVETNNRFRRWFLVKKKSNQLKIKIKG